MTPKGRLKKGAGQAPLLAIAHSKAPSLGLHESQRFPQQWLPLSPKEQHAAAVAAKGRLAAGALREHPFPGGCVIRLSARYD